MNPSAHSSAEGIDLMRSILVTPEITRLSERIDAYEAKSATSIQAHERRLQEWLQVVAERMTADREEFARLAREQTDRMTQAMEQVTAQFGRRIEALTAQSVARLDELAAQVTALQRDKLGNAEFGATLAAIGQRYSEAPARESSHPVPDTRPTASATPSGAEAAPSARPAPNGAYETLDAFFAAAASGADHEKTNGNGRERGNGNPGVTMSSGHVDMLTILSGRRPSA